VDYVARMDSDDLSVPERIETQVNFMIENPKVDIVGSSVLVFQDEVSVQMGKILSMPTLDQLIKYNMIFYCCIQHPTLMFRAVSIGPQIKYSLTDPVSKSLEDYELWLRLIYQDQPPTFANIGTVLLYLRKHNANKSTGVPISVEIPLKAKYLCHHVKGLLQQEMLANNQIVEEFIKLTGRQARADTF
jgi:hypothetical protein